VREFATNHFEEMVEVRPAALALQKRLRCPFQTSQQELIGVLRTMIWW
jgi:hypothetical protein